MIVIDSSEANNILSTRLEVGQGHHWIIKVSGERKYISTCENNVAQCNSAQVKKVGMLKRYFPIMRRLSYTPS